MNRILLLIFLLSSVVFYSSCKGPQTTISDGATDSTVLSEKEQVGFTYIFMNAAKEKMLGNYETAAALFRESIRLNPNDPTAYYELAQVYYFTGNRDQAVEMASKAVSLEPENPWYHVLLVGMLQETDDYAGAAKELLKLQKLQPNKLEYRFEYAEALMKSGKLTEALKEYDAIEEVVGISEDVSRQKQMIHLQMNNIDKAAEEIERLIEAFPRESRYLAMLADIYRSNDQEEKAFPIYQRILETDPENPYALLSLADHYRMRGDQAKAFTYLQTAYSNPALDIDTKVKILLSYYVMSEENGKLKDEAYQLASILKETHPTEAKSYAVSGDFLVRDKKYEEARVEFRKAVDLDPSRLPIWTQLLLIESELGDFKSLLSESLRALELFPSNPSLHFFAGVAYSRLDQIEEAIESLETAASFVVDDPNLASQIYSSLGDAYHQQNQHAESDAAYDKSLGFNPNNAFVLNNYSYYLSLRKEKLPLAAAMALKANQTDPGNASFQDTYGWILFVQGKYSDAETWLKKAVDSDGGNSAVIMEHYGDVLFKLGKREEALVSWKKAFSLDPDNQELKRRIETGGIPEP